MSKMCEIVRSLEPK